VVALPASENYGDSDQLHYHDGQEVLGGPHVDYPIAGLIAHLAEPLVELVADVFVAGLTGHDFKPVRSRLFRYDVEGHDRQQNLEHHVGIAREVGVEDAKVQDVLQAAYHAEEKVH
jgi:hypothetical protein